MSITGFDFPKVTLRQVFEAEAPAAVSEMGVVCLGPLWTYNDNADTALRDIDVSYSGTEPIISAGLPDITVTPYDSRFDVELKSGIWPYHKITLTGTNSEWSENNPDLIVLDDTQDLLSFGGRVLQPNDFVVVETADALQLRPVNNIITKDFNGHKSVRKNTISLGNKNGDNVYDALEKKPVSITYCFVANWSGAVQATDVTGGRVYFGASSFEAAMNELMPGSTVDSTAADYDVLGLWGFDNLLEWGMNARYRAASTEQLVFGTVGSVSDILTTLGPINVNNPLALGCYCALSAGGGAVYFAGIPSSNQAEPNPTDYVYALDYCDRYDGIYSVVPCTEDSDVISACAGKVEATSSDVENKVWRTLWYGVSCKTPEASGANKGKIKVGTGYYADTAVNQIDYILAKRVTRSVRAQCVWADGATIMGEPLDGHDDDATKATNANYALAAAAAGMRAGQPVHRPLSNLGYSFFSLREPHSFAKTQLKRLGSNGIWIIANNIDGAPVNMRQMTTAVANSLNMDEESVIANADNVAMSVAGVGSNIVGSSNISPDLLLALETAIRDRLNLKLVPRYGAYIGPQLLDWEFIRAPYQDPVNRDHVLAEFSITPPRPFNQFHMTLVVL